MNWREGKEGSGGNLDLQFVLEKVNDLEYLSSQDTGAVSAAGVMILVCVLRCVWPPEANLG